MNKLRWSPLRALRFTKPFLVASALLIPAAALAISFPDVGRTHIHRAAIERLADMGVINGNPNGTFDPERVVNRAELLKMLYVAAGKTPATSNLRCFPDIEAGSWYAPYVCDAVAKKHVKGYNDGNFRPATPVNRVEALKMIQEVMSFAVPGANESSRALVKFVDVSLSAWYTDYLVNAYVTGILPIAGQNADRFTPEAGLTRGEAAAYISNALNARLPSRSSSSRRSSASSSPADNVFDVSIPFTDQSSFLNKGTIGYRFSLTQAQVIAATVDSYAADSDIECTLYKEDESGFFYEYYLGVVDDGGCHLLVGLTAGSYQLQLRPTEAGLGFTVEAKAGQGDGNDGFSQAKLLNTLLQAETLGNSNLQNWYWFKVTEPAGKTMRIDLTNAQNLTCIVQAFNDVDLFGFGSPECNQDYLFPPGTYYVGVGKRPPRDARETYSIRLQP